MSTLTGARSCVSAYAEYLKNNRKLVFLLVATALSLYLLALINPFSIPTIDDSAIVMRYLKNFQTGHFFAYNVSDGPVYGVSGFIYGLAAGILCWIGLDPHASIMIVSFVGTVGMFYCLLRIAYHVSQSVVLSVIGVLVVYFSSSYLPATLYLGLEVSVNLWLVMACFLYFFEQKQVSFYLCCVLAIISKLDTLSLVAGLIFLHLLRAGLAKQLRAQIRPLLLFFFIPLLAWIIFAWATFHSPLPESFLSKFLFRNGAPRTSWFPFLEPMIAGHVQAVSISLMGAAMLATPLIAYLRRTLFLPSLIMAAAAIGTLLLYLVYNPGERMAWYYPLPELLMLLSTVLAVFDALATPSRTARIAVTLLVGCLVLVVLDYRLPLNLGAPYSTRYGQIIFESERRDSGILANEVAPKENPVLWTGHGYPAYEFNGFIADYSGLNTRAIWHASRDVAADTPEAHAFFQQIGISNSPPAYKAEMYLIKMYNANVFMLHGLFPESVQKGLGLRLAGTFYTIDIVGAPAFRVFVKDPQHERLIHSVPIGEVKGVGGDVQSGSLYVTAQTVSIPVPAHAGKLLFGIKTTPDDQDLNVEDDSGKSLGTCHVAKIADLQYPGTVRPCEISASGSFGAGRITVRDGSGKPITLFEPTFEDSAVS